MQEEEKNLKSLSIEQQFQMIEKLATRLGVPDPSQRPVLHIRSGSDEQNKILEMVRGSWGDKQPWFVIDENGELLILSTAEAIKGIMSSLQHMGEEVFKARLERAIAKELPVDFHDVWTVAMHELQQRLKESGQQPASIDLEHLIQSIKRRHPNLFYSLKDLQIDAQDINEAGIS